MSAGFVVALALGVAVVVGSRFLVPALPLRAHAVGPTPAELALALLGLAGLGFHCGAMFFADARHQVLPFADGVAEDIRALGPASVAWYVVPAVLLVLALRRLPPAAVLVVVAALVAIGVTMYAGSPLQVHLAAIFAGVLLLTAVAAALVVRPVQGTARG